MNLQEFYIAIATRRGQGINLSYSTWDILSQNPIWLKTWSDYHVKYVMDGEPDNLKEWDKKNGSYKYPQPKSKEVIRFINR